MPYFQQPILFLIFNRPDRTNRVFEAIRLVKPTKLYIAADGPRHEQEQALCEQTRKIIKQIDWPCELKTLFRENNLGCKVAISSAIDWFFTQEEMGIILEDDCLPVAEFFHFCDEMLVRYKDDVSIMHIGGTNPVDRDAVSNTYYFSKYNRIWGWATWRRAWKHYDVKIAFWPEYKRSAAYKQLFTGLEARYFTLAFDKVYKGLINTWDFQWLLCRVRHGKAIIPCANLVTNIGFGEQSTHTKTVNQFANIPYGRLQFPLQHPASTEIDFVRDARWRKSLIKENFLFLLKSYLPFKGS